MSLARRNLFQDKTRLTLSIGGVALAVMLILILKGFLAGMNHQITSYLDNSPGSIVIAEEDVVNLLGATSLIPEGTDQKAESVGCRACTPPRRWGSPPGSWPCRWVRP